MKLTLRLRFGRGGWGVRHSQVARSPPSRQRTPGARRRPPPCSHGSGRSMRPTCPRVSRRQVERDRLLPGWAGRVGSGNAPYAGDGSVSRTISTKRAAMASKRVVGGRMGVATSLNFPSAWILKKGILDHFWVSGYPFGGPGGGFSYECITSSIGLHAITK